MPFENYPSAENPQLQPQPKKKDSRTYILIALIVALLATWGYIIWDKGQTTETLAQKDKQYTTAVSEKDTLQSELDQAALRYDDLKSSSALKDSTISAQDKEIADEKASIQSILSDEHATKEQYALARKKLASLNSEIASYKTQIETLKGENTQLTQEKQQVTQQRDVAKQQVDSSSTVIKEKENIIDIGSTLHASNFIVLGIDQKSNGKEKETENAKRVNKLKIIFDLDENLITQSGNKTLYVCITGPDGKAISIESLGSGIFTTRDSNSKAFTQKLDVNYTQGKRQTVSFEWKQNAAFAVGNYKIEVYNNGFKIGESTRELKKGGLFG